ncbi:MAG: PleD family two-component system response regulator [Alphaproteobacteria bacterium]|nr:PleD family two-component system response regulator [Alphaproteobacteria bacterium]MCB9929857.1 PleD family two-component system response regulator [Alphaproteobacteria bacterium]
MTARILVVDDIIANRKLLEAKLTAEYYDVAAVASGKEALSAVEQNAPDLILLDVMMPGLSGYDVCSRLKADHRFSHIPVVMVTALDSPQDMVRGLESGADDFLTKPLDNLALFARVRNLVRLKRVLDEWRLRESDTMGDVGYEALADESVTDARLFLMSDSASVHEIVQRTAAELQHEVVVCRPDQAPPGQLLDGAFDLILADIGYQPFDALRLCSQARSTEATRHLPFILIGDRSDSERLYKGLDLGANECLVRPLNPSEVMARLKTQIRRHRLQLRIQNRHHQNLNHAVTDALTGLYNRHYMDAHLARLHARAVGDGRPLSVIVCDLDRFKAINDTYGHPIGDQVLRHVADKLSAGVRSPDLVARQGGEEFVIVLPNTALADAERVADRLRRALAESAVPLAREGAVLKVTASFGVSEIAWDEPSADEAVRRADEALYQSKHQGRNRVTAMPAGTIGAPLPDAAAALSAAR